MTEAVEGFIDTVIQCNTVFRSARIPVIARMADGLKDVHVMDFLEVTQFYFPAISVNTANSLF